MKRSDLSCRPRRAWRGRAVLASLPAWATFLALGAAQDAHGQTRTFPRGRGQAPAPTPSSTDAAATPAPSVTVPTPAPSSPVVAATPNAAGTPGTPATGPAGKPGPQTLPNGKQVGDTTGLTQFENGVEFQPRSPDYKVTFSLEDADLDAARARHRSAHGEAVHLRREGRNIKATVYSPQKVTVAEAYQAFLVDPRNERPHRGSARTLPEDCRDRRASRRRTPRSTPPGKARRTRNGTSRGSIASRTSSADEAKAVLDHFKTKDGDITVYGPGNLLIITDTGLEHPPDDAAHRGVDVGGAGDQMSIEPIHYASASDMRAA